MKKNWFRTTLIVVLFLVTIYYLLPLIAQQDYIVCDLEVFDQDGKKIYEIAEKEYEVGSNLYGTEFENALYDVNINDTIQVETELPDNILRTIDAEIDYNQPQLLEAVIKDKISRVTLPSWFTDKQLKLGLDLQGGMHLVMQVETDKLSKKAKDSAVKGALEIIRNRVDEFGVSEPTIQRIGDNRILVQLPGLRNASRAKELIGKTAQLEFHLVAKDEDLSETVEAIDGYLQNNYQKYAYLKKIEEKEQAGEKTAVEETLLKTEEEEDTTQDLLEPEQKTEKDTIGAAEQPETEKLDEPKDNLFSSLISVYQNATVVTPENLPLFRKIISNPEVGAVIPSGVSILLGKINPEDPYGARPVYFLYDEVELTGADLKSADVRIGQGMDPKLSGKPYVSLEFNNEGARIFSNVTGQNRDERLAIVLEDVVHSAPRINDKIRNGSAMITGNFEMSEAKDVSIVLNAGRLPAPVHIIEERTVGPSLGSDSIEAGFNAAIIGLILVAIFMVIYYKLSGFIADFALISNVLIIMAFLTMLSASLTLPGIAGIILTIGMAVDANVLIFERIREELDSGKTVRTAIDNGYKRAIVTIADANITTLITAVVLYQFGTGPIKGFAVTLSLGILSSMFTAIIVTRSIFDMIVARKPRKKLSI